MAQEIYDRMNRCDHSTPFTVQELREKLADYPGIWADLPTPKGLTLIASAACLSYWDIFQELYDRLPDEERKRAIPAIYVGGNHYLIHDIARNPKMFEMLWTDEVCIPLIQKTYVFDLLVRYLAFWGDFENFKKVSQYGIVKPRIFQSAVTRHGKYNPAIPRYMLTELHVNPNYDYWPCYWPICYAVEHKDDELVRIMVSETIVKKAEETGQKELAEFLRGKIEKK